MCGASSQEETIAGQQQGMSNTLQSNYNTNYGAQSQELSKLNNLLTPIANAGPSQTGFAAPETAALNTELGEGVGSNYASAAKQLNTQLDSEGGGNSGDTNFGGKSQLKETLASGAANNLATGQSQIESANYAQGNKNWQAATSGLQALGSEYNPSQIAGEATTSTNQAFGSASNNANATAQQFGEIAGGVAALGQAGAKIATAGAG
jgi:hypothetical protein